MTIFALEQAVSNGCQPCITEVESALGEIDTLRARINELEDDAKDHGDALTINYMQGVEKGKDVMRAENAQLRKQASDHEQVIIERFLTRTGQYVTNDAARESAIEAGRAELRAQLAEAQAALKTVMRNAELSKEPCGSDPESPAAIRNSKFASLSSIAAQGLGMVRGPSLTAQLAEAQRDLIAKESELDGLRASRIAYAKEFPLNADGEPDVGNIHANIRSLKAQLAEAKADNERLLAANLDCIDHFEAMRDDLAEVQRDAERYDYLRKHSTFFDPSQNDTSFLREPPRRIWYHETPHIGADTLDAAIDAAKGESNGSN